MPFPQEDGHTDRQIDRQRYRLAVVRMPHKSTKPRSWHNENLNQQPAATRHPVKQPSTSLSLSLSRTNIIIIKLRIEVY